VQTSDENYLFLQELVPQIYNHLVYRYVFVQNVPASYYDCNCF